MRRFLRHLVVGSAVLFLDPVAHAWGQTDSKLEPAPSGFASHVTASRAARSKPSSTIQIGRRRRKNTMDPPPGHSKEIKYPVLYPLQAPAITKGAGPGGVQLTHSRQSLRRQEDRPHDRGHAQRLSPGAEGGHGPCGAIMKRADADKNGVCAGRVPRRRRGPLQGPRYRQTGRETIRRRPQSSDAGTARSGWPPAARRLRQRL